MSPVILTVPGQPQGKARARVTRNGTYTPAKTKAYETLLALAGKRAMGIRPPLTGPLQIDIKAYFGVPESWSNKKRAEALDGRLRPTTKPDIDNICKAMDGLNKIVWIDDAQIVSARIIKRYSTEPRLVITVDVII